LPFVDGFAVTVDALDSVHEKDAGAFGGILLVEGEAGVFQILSKAEELGAKKSFFVGEFARDLGIEAFDLRLGKRLGIEAMFEGIVVAGLAPSTTLGAGSAALVRRLIEVVHSFVLRSPGLFL
jgi:hypothetical protein